MHMAGLFGGSAMCMYVRSLKGYEGEKLGRILRRSKDAIKVRRAQVILASAQGMRVLQIASLTHLFEGYVRTLIHGFNKDGFSSLEPRYGGGRPAKIGEEQKAEIIELALMPPGVLGLPFTSWSLSKLRQCLLRRGTVKGISRERLRQILKEAAISHQRTRTWKESNDPQYESKKNGSKRSTRRRRQTAR